LSCCLRQALPGAPQTEKRPPKLVCGLLRLGDAVIEPVPRKL
jgi:hypothetical protein